MIQIGDSAYGGIIFYVDKTGNHGLVVATVDQGMTSWGNPEILINKGPILSPIKMGHKIKGGKYLQQFKMV